MGKQQIRARKEPSPGKKVSDVEAAYVVQSYLIEKQFTNALAGFRVDAAPTLNSLKNAPPAVRSLATILNDFVTLREKQHILQEENARLEECLKETQKALQQERSRVNSFVQGVHESLAVFQSGCGSPNTLALPSMSSSPTNSAPIFQVGQNTPPAMVIDLTKTPCSIRTNSASASNKRKNGVNKTPQEAPPSRIAAVKKARSGGQISGSLPGGSPSSPWMCGMVRKNSLNMVRQVVQMPYQEMHYLTSGAKTPQPGRSVPSFRNTTQLSSPPATSTEEPAPQNPASPPDHTNQQNISSSAPLNTCSEPSARACLIEGQAPGQDPETPPRTYSLVPQPEQVPLLSQSSENSADMSPLDAKSCTPQSALEQSTQQLGEDRSAHEIAVHSDSSSGSPDSSHSDRTQEDFHFKKMPSRTMRPLDFSDSALAPQAGSPACQISPPTTLPSEYEDASAGAEIGDSSDLFLIDDILASLDDASFSCLVGDMLGTEEITMNDLVSNSQTFGDVDFSNMQSVTNRSSIGEDSFGFHCLAEEANCEEIPAPAAGGVLEDDGCAKTGPPLKIVSAANCSLPPTGGVLSERDPNQAGDGPKKCGSPLKPSSKRETKAKYAFGQENVPVADLVNLVEGGCNLSTCS